jgi:uncharacterized membrane protein YedE/YeeE
MELIVIAWPVLAVVAAWIARSKGRSFVVWVLYGLILMPVALIHALVIHAPEPTYVPVSTPASFEPTAPLSIADELMKLADLQERGFITKAEYEERKAILLAERSQSTVA